MSVITSCKKNDYSNKKQNYKNNFDFLVWKTFGRLSSAEGKTDNVRVYYNMIRLVAVRNYSVVVGSILRIVM
jgi:hypothetical protein